MPQGCVSSQRPYETPESLRSCRTSLSGSGGMTWPSDEWLSICDEPSWNARWRVYRIPPTFECVRGDAMTGILRALALAAAAGTLALPAFAQQPGPPAWVQRGIPGAGHAALAPLAGTWRTEVSIYGTMGRSPDLPPIVSRDVRTTRVWVADGQYLEDTTEGTVDGQPYWRRGWLGYSILDRRYEWVTIAPRVPMMIYLGKPGSGARLPIEVSGVFTDQGVISEQTVGKPVGQRTVFRIEGDDRHVSELYFTPPGGREQLALRLVYTRVN